MRLAVAILLGLCLALGCVDSDVVGPRHLATFNSPSFDVFIPVPGEGGQVCWGYLQGTTYTGTWLTGNGPPCYTTLDVSPGPAVYEDPYAGPYDIAVVFSQAVADLVITPLSAWRCGADPGSATAYSPSGASVTMPFSVDESDCGSFRGDPASVHYYQDASAPQALLVTGLDSVKRVVLKPTGVLMWETILFYPIYSGFPSELIGWREESSPSPAGTTYVFSFREPLPGQTAAAVTTLKAEGPNPAGSFTGKPGEGQIALQAQVTPASLASAVTWRIEEDPSHYPLSPLPPSPPQDADASFTVRTLEPSRWPGDHAASLQLEPKELSYKVTATVTDGQGHVIESETKTVTQDEIDTVREEYVEFGLPVPGRGQFTGEPPRDPGINTGDYGVMVWNNDFTAALNALAFAWTSFGEWQVNSQYRNPVHQQLHVGSEPSSAHPYSCAADLQTFPVRDADPVTHIRFFRSEQDSLVALGFWDDLAALADEAGFTVERIEGSTIGHVHVQRSC